MARVRPCGNCDVIAGNSVVTEPAPGITAGQAASGGQDEPIVKHVRNERMDTRWVNVDQIEQVAGLLALPAETVKRSWTTFLETARSLGSPWGDDDIGRQWAQVYEPALTNFDGNMQLIVKALLGLSDGLSTTARLYGAVEDANLS